MNDQEPLPPFLAPPSAPRLVHAWLPPASPLGAPTSAAPPPPPPPPPHHPAPLSTVTPTPIYGNTGPPVPIANLIHGNPHLPHGPPYVIVQAIPTLYGPAQIRHIIFPSLPLPPHPPPPVQHYPTPPPSPQTGLVGQP